MHSRTWKRFELETARELGTERELFAGSGGDIKHSLFLIDTKNRARWSISAWFAKLRKDAGDRSKIPLLIVKEPQKHLKLAIVELHVMSSLLRAAGWDSDTELSDIEVDAAQEPARYANCLVSGGVSDTVQAFCRPEKGK